MPNAANLLMGAISDDSRFVIFVTKASTSDLVNFYLWDVEKGVIVNRYQAKSESYEFSRIVFDPSGRSAIAEGSVAPDANAGPCRLVRLTVNLLSGQITEKTLASAQWPAHGKPTKPIDSICKGEWGQLATPLRENRQHLVLKMDTTPIELIDAGGQTVTRFDVVDQPEFSRATANPDLSRIALAYRIDDPPRTLGDIDQPRSVDIRIFDIETARYLPAVHLPPDYDPDAIAWLDKDHLLAVAQGIANRPDAANKMVPARVIDVRTGVDSASPVPARCFMKPLPGAIGFVGAGLANCSKGPNVKDRGLQHFTPETGWQTIAVRQLAGLVIDDLAVSADGKMVAAMAHNKAWMIDLASGRVLQSAKVNFENNGIRYLADGRILIDAYDDDQWLVWEAGRPPAHFFHARSDDRPAVRMVAAPTPDGGEILGLQDVAGGPPRDPCAGSTGDLELALREFSEWNTLSADGRFLTVESEHDSVKIYNMHNCRLLLTVNFLAFDGFFAATPTGHYDTNQGPDTNTIRWVARDAPMQSLAPQSFMRQMYEPGLAGRLLECYRKQNCLTPFKPLQADMLSLNRVLPTVRSLEIVNLPTPGTIKVNIGVEPGFDPEAPNGKTHSGIYDLRLFRDGQLVAQWRNASAADARAEPSSLAAWRTTNELTPGPDGLFHASAVIRLAVDVIKPLIITQSDGGRRRLPDEHRHRISAYAFNEDRIKGDSRTKLFQRFAPSPPQRRAFVLSIGINRYDIQRLRLQYAAADAALVTQRLATLPGYEVHNLTLAGSDQRITKAVIFAALRLLAPPESITPKDRSFALNELLAAGIDGSAFESATPYDLVIVSFSGHGWTDRDGNFFILPADAKWLPTGPPQDLGSLIGADELARLIEAIDAGNMALLIDACHSAASVAVDGFKPGPMGDAGLGQLAYDKGIRIIAASQSDDVAMEDGTLQHGLLTYALAVKGIDEQGFGEADLNHDKRIKLDEWLRYAVEQLPSLSTQTKLRRSASGFGGKRRVTVISDSQAVPPKPQVPSLFDFNAANSAIVLRDAEAQ
jgi:uncharacterized caspase-like protein